MDPGRAERLLRGSSNGITVYLRISPGGPAGTAPWQGYVAEDKSGFRYPQEGGYCSFGDSKGNMIYGLILRCFPRREPEFVLRLLDQSGLALGTLHVRNPFPGPFPEWQPMPLPQTQTNGVVQLTLYGFEERVNGQWTNINAAWGLQATDPAWTHARARTQIFLDPTGNEGRFLSPKEPAWKARTLVYRERIEDFAPGELLVLTNVALPTPGNFVPIDATAGFSGVSINVLALASAGSFGLSNGVTRFMLPISQGSSGHSVSSGSKDTIETWGSPPPFLMVEARNMQQDDELHAQIRDQSGEELKVTMAGYNTGQNGARIYKPGFNPAPGTKSLTVRIWVSRPLPFEFIVRPEEVQKNLLRPD